jgi:hypothetical protein
VGFIVSYGRDDVVDVIDESMMGRGCCLRSDGLWNRGVGRVRKRDDVLGNQVIKGKRMASWFSVNGQVNWGLLEEEEEPITPG